MLGESLAGAVVTEHGLFGDRQFALIDHATDKAIRAKQFPELFTYQARLKDSDTLIGSNGKCQVAITMPGGEHTASDDPHVDTKLSDSLGRSVTLAEISTWSNGDKPGFFDDALVHLITTSTLKSLSQYYPAGIFDPRRFRPNLLIELSDETPTFVEDSWLGSTLHIGENVCLSITDHCARCIMTTHAQPGLPADANIFTTAVDNNNKNVGVYASILSTGLIQLGDAVRLNS